MINYILEDWLLEAETPPSSSPGDAAQGPPDVDAYSNSMGAEQQGDPNIAKPPQEPEDDVSQDPHVPDMPEQKQHHFVFTQWKQAYFKESITGNTQKLVTLLTDARDRKLGTYERKFVEDNWQIQQLRQNSNIDSISKDIRRNIKGRMDRNNPATTLVNYLVASLETQPTLNNVFIKLIGYNGLKGDLHRKFIASLLGGIQVGAGGNTEDLLYTDKEYSIRISTRCNADWGEIMLGSWALKANDMSRFLSEPELKRLHEGSPDEKDVLRRRVVMESITNQYQTRAFMFSIIGDDGTIYNLGLDLATCLPTAYADGKLIVKTTVNENADGMLTEEGKLISYMDVDIFYGKETGEQNEDGSPEVQELPFIQRKNGQLFLVADLNTIKEAAGAMQGMTLKESPYNGNPSDLQVLSRCVFTASDLLMKVC